jgi:hypothetical protein
VPRAPPPHPRPGLRIDAWTRHDLSSYVARQSRRRNRRPSPIASRLGSEYSTISLSPSAGRLDPLNGSAQIAARRVVTPSRPSRQGYVTTPDERCAEHSVNSTPPPRVTWVWSAVTRPASVATGVGMRRDPAPFSVAALLARPAPRRGRNCSLYEVTPGGRESTRLSPGSDRPAGN